jgi:hypothetical protein
LVLRSASIRSAKEKELDYLGLTVMENDFTEQFLDLFIPIWNILFQESIKRYGAAADRGTRPHPCLAGIRL